MISSSAYKLQDTDSSFVSSSGRFFIEATGLERFDAEVEHEEFAEVYNFVTTTLISSVTVIMQLTRKSD